MYFTFLGSATSLPLGPVERELPRGVKMANYMNSVLFILTAVIVYYYPDHNIENKIVLIAVFLFASIANFLLLAKNADRKLSSVHRVQEKLFTMLVTILAIGTFYWALYSTYLYHEGFPF